MTDVQVLSLKYDLNESSIHSVEKQVMSLLSKGCSRIVLEGKQVEHIDWPAVGKILGWKRVLRQLEGDIKIAELPNGATEPFHRFGANQVLELYPTVREAMNSFQDYLDASNC